MTEVGVGSDLGAANGRRRASRRLVLASASPARRRLLVNAGVQPTVITSNVDEDAIATADPPNPQWSTVSELVALLAGAKCADVVERLNEEQPAAQGPPEGLVLGCDSLLEWQGQVLGKPGSAQAAVERLESMQGTSGVLHTGHCLVDLATGSQVEQVASTQVDFAAMTRREIEAYVATGEPLAVAGSFTLDGLSSPFISGVVGDPSNVIGLSLPLLRTMLARLDVEWLDIVDY